MSPFDPVGGELAKQEGMQRAKEHANPAYLAIMHEAGVVTAKRQPLFTTDALELYRQLHHGPDTHEHRVIGPIMLGLAREGICVRTEHTQKSKQRVNHRRDMRIWRSLIFPWAKNDLARLAQAEAMVRRFFKNTGQRASEELVRQLALNMLMAAIVS